MSGHSKWSTIKRKKGTVDAKRGQLFTKVVRELSVAARQGGPDPTLNVRLRLALEKAREANMPADNIERAIKRGGGGDATEKVEEITYEGYGPGGAAILLQTITDNRNRTVSELRAALTRGGGSLGETGGVAWAFEPRGVVTIETPNAEEAEKVALAAIDAGAEDFKLEDGVLEIYGDPRHFDAIRQSIDAQGAEVASAELSMVPKATVPLDAKSAEQMLRLLERLEEMDDVQRVYTNAEFPQEVVERYGSEAAAR
ncbi:MAG: YebC/PmpR family DNA-binding transcriptional regulator [Chloroflexi bacterium]|nr:YebC/PmpR family DNA-binding transcriptional regulator [Chloroflexota bacterium]